MAARWVTVYLDGDYFENKYKNVFAAYIHPIVLELGGTNAKCVTYQNMTEAEYKLDNVTRAQKVKKAITNMFRSMPNPFIAGKAVVSVMPQPYEKLGSRGIVRPDYHTDERLMMKPVPGFAKLVLAKKYLNRSSPPLPASDYCEAKIKGTDGAIYMSVKNKLNVCQWKRFAD